MKGVTLVEVVVAVAIALFMVLGIGVMDVGRLRMENELRSRSGATSEQAKVALAALSFTKALERADRINICNTGIGGSQPYQGPPDRGDIQIRTFEPDTDCPAVGAGCPAVCPGCTGAAPPACCFDIPGNYRWDEYKRNRPTDEIWLYRDVPLAGPCPAKRVLAGETVAMTVTFRNEAAAPPGTNPPIVGSAGNEDNNTVGYTIRWDNGLNGSARMNQDFRGQTTSRAIPYSNINAVVGNSGWGQATGAADPSPPPAACP